MFFVELWLLTNTLAPLSGSAPRSRSRDGVDLDEVRACGCRAVAETARRDTRHMERRESRITKRHTPYPLRSPIPVLCPSHTPFIK